MSQLVKMPPLHKKFKPVLWLVLGTWSISILFWSFLPGYLQINESSDFHNFYQPVAQRLLNGQGLTTPNGLPALRYPPGYPFILAGVLLLAQTIHISISLAIQLFILVCVGLITYILFLLSSEVFGIKAGFLTGLIWITYPIFLWLGKQPNSELPFLVLFLAGVLFFWKAFTKFPNHWPVWGLAGALIGCSVLVRPSGLGVIGVFVIASLVSRRLSLQQKAFACLALTSGFGIILLPWELWVYSQTGQVIPVSTGAVPGVWDGLTFGVVGEEYLFRENLPLASRQFMEGLLQQAIQRGGVHKIQDIRDIFILQARSQPLAAAQFIILKAFRSWFATESGRFDYLNLAVQSFYFIGITCGALTAGRIGGIQREFLGLVLGTTIYFWMVTLVSLSIVRYTIPALGLLFTLIPAGLFRIKHLSLFLDRLLVRFA